MHMHMCMSCDARTERARTITQTGDRRPAWTAFAANCTAFEHRTVRVEHVYSGRGAVKISAPSRLYVRACVL